MFEVKGKRAIITGGAKGFGKHFAKRLLLAGCKVCITDVDGVGGEETRDQFERLFGLRDDRYKNKSTV